jgi:putative transcriptional regulator
MTITEIREMSRLSRAAFSRQYKIPVRTLEDWEAGKRTPPEYVLELLARVVDADSRDPQG